MNPTYLIAPIALFVYGYVANYISYRIIKKRILESQPWGLNVCCGYTDGSGVNADIVQHGDVPNFVKVDDVYNLPFADNQFDSVLCSHTIEHVDDPDRFMAELMRVGKEVTIVIPPIWDIAATLNIFEHRTLFLTLNKKHVNKLPPHINLPGARWFQNIIGQRIRA